MAAGSSGETCLASCLTGSGGMTKSPLRLVGVRVAAIDGLIKYPLPRPPLLGRRSVSNKTLLGEVGILDPNAESFRLTLGRTLTGLAFCLQFLRRLVTP